MKIAQLNFPAEYYSPYDGGAVGRVIREQTLELMARGHSVTVLTVPSPAGDYDAGTVIPLALGRRHELPFLRRALCKAKSRLLKWDLPYYDIFISSVIRSIIEAGQVPNLVITHNDLVAPRYLKARFPSATLAAMLHNVQRPALKDPVALAAPVDVFLTVSEFLRDWAVEELGLPAAKVAAVGNGVNLREFQPPPGWPARPDGPLRVLVVGRVEPNKGQDLVARAVSELASEGVSVSLTLAGPVWMFGSEALQTSPYLEEVLAAATPASCEYLGHVPHDRMPALYGSHDVLCLVSRSREGFGLAVLEAMACGCAVVASDRGGLDEACGGAAIVVCPDRLATVTDELRLLAVSPDRLVEWKRRARARAEQASWGRVVDRLLSAIAGVTSQ